MDDRDLVKVVAEVIGADRTADDCAIIPFGDEVLVLTTDMLHETTDFPAGMTDYERGWMAAAVTLSDVASMGAAPVALVLAAGLDRPERLRGITTGANDCCTTYGCRLAGGDVDAHDECTLVSTGLGRVAADRVVRRTGAVPGDVVGVVGACGCAQAGLDGSPDHWKALVMPRPRVREGQALGEGGATAMMDISDGLALSLHDLAAASGVGIEVAMPAVPLPEGVKEPAASRYALYGGGDFGLLFTCPAECWPLEGVDSVIIGRVVAGEGVRLDGRPLPARGYAHRWDGNDNGDVGPADS
ncbi:thiamine-monophosphate kinase [Methanomicrobiaceae archaeon CYW5]|uniref:thiamine-phosphate kinase n=1 Tax=Methanovulcanius yangii TaxID=1789227 RepID=UPI0029CA12BF|nr:thiamine-phosphate kinase [Methanovulcanius yangii]MBT8508231.1 thiamine-monophosphate kinase [Methanovulcanius yangii]